MLLTIFAMSSCAPRGDGVMIYRSIEVSGRPWFDESRYDGKYTREMEMRIVEGSRLTEQPIWWDNDVLDRRRIDAKRRYQFEILEGFCISTLGTEMKTSEVLQVHDNHRLIYDASFCRVHEQAMLRESQRGGIDAESLPRGFESVKRVRFPNTRFYHDACASLKVCTTLDWTCPQCSEAETKWLEKHPK